MSLYAVWFDPIHDTTSAIKVEGGTAADQDSETLTPKLKKPTPASVFQGSYWVAEHKGDPPSKWLDRRKV
jgi:hypothetical protein